MVDGYVKAGFWIDYKNQKYNLTKSGDNLGAVLSWSIVLGCSIGNIGLKHWTKLQIVIT